MQKKTLAQQIALNKTRTDSQKVKLFVQYGFTQAEAEQMVKGSTLKGSYDRLGGVWQVGNVQWQQAISKEHAQKLHIWTFGVIEETNLVRTDSQGLTWVIE